MMPDISKKKRRMKKPSFRFIFPALVFLLYGILWLTMPDQAFMAARASGHMLTHLLWPLVLVFLFMIGLNIFLKPLQLAKILAKNTPFKQKLFFAAAGIISSGPIYAWYPLLKDFREKGAAPSLMAVFLVNRAVKLFLLPLMISIFGWQFVAALTVLTVAGSFLVGEVVGALTD